MNRLPIVLGAAGLAIALAAVPVTGAMHSGVACSTVLYSATPWPPFFWIVTDVGGNVELYMEANGVADLQREDSTCYDDTWWTIPDINLTPP